mgnify:CR=1 FL=1
MSKNYQIKLEKYLKIDKTSENEIEYTLLEGCGISVDGGIIVNTQNKKLSDEEILKIVLEGIDFNKNIEIKESDEIEEINPLVFKDNASNIPMTRDELAELYWNGDKEKIKKYGYPVQRLALYSAECKCNGFGKFVLEKATKENNNLNQKHFIRCKICGERSCL